MITLERQIQKYKDDPDWKERLIRRRGLLDKYAEELELSEKEENDPENISRWPSPSRMIKANSEKDRIKDPDKKALLAHVHRWHYGPLSWDSHVLSSTLVRRGSVFLKNTEEDKHEESIFIYRSQSILTAHTFYMAILSEISMAMGLDYERRKLAYIWSQIREWPDAEELIQLRYGKEYDLE